MNASGNPKRFVKQLKRFICSHEILIQLSTVVSKSQKWNFSLHDDHFTFNFTKQFSCKMPCFRTNSSILADLFRNPAFVHFESNLIWCSLHWKCSTNRMVTPLHHITRNFKLREMIRNMSTKQTQVCNTITYLVTVRNSVMSWWKANETG